MDLEAVMAARVQRGAIKVPPSPVVALRMMQLLADENTPLSTLRSTIEQDQALTAVVLRLSNSSYYRRANEVVSIADAVLVLGRKTLREVSVAKELHERTLGAGALVALRRRAWRESLVSAHLCSFMAPWFDLKADEVFVAGLLHDIGRVPAIGVLEQLLVEHPDADTRTEAGWWGLVEEHHVTLGAILARSWGLPSVVGAAIAEHHGPGQTPVIELLRIVDEVVRLMDGVAVLTGEQLGAIAGLSTPQCVELAAQLPRLPSVLDAFREPASNERLGVIDYELKVAEEVRAPVNVVVTCEGLVSPVALVAAAEDLLMVAKAFKPGALVQVQAGEARFHARVTARGPDASELRPWGLDARQLDDWRRFLAQPVERAA